MVWEVCTKASVGLTEAMMVQGAIHMASRLVAIERLLEGGTTLVKAMTIQLFDQRRCRVAPPAQAGRLWLGPRRGLVRCADHVLGHSTSAGCGRVLEHSVCVHVCTYMRVFRCLFVIYAQRPIALLLALT